jgi:uncharacterized membrane protein YedE/YeeE
MRYLKFLLVGVLFGIVLSKAEIISWYRIYEMFRFESFHMYGVIGSAVLIGIVMVQVMKRIEFKGTHGEQVQFVPKTFSVPRYLFGGILFGLGWAMIGACPGPVFILLGKGVVSILVVILGALIGTFLYGIWKHKLPH